MALQPTDEQLFVLKQYLTGDDLVIEAGAGAGKTSTLRLLAEKAKDRSGMYLAFNKAIADEAKQKFHGTSIQAKTSHALAFRSVHPALKERLSLPFPKARDEINRFDIRPVHFGRDDDASVSRLDAYSIYRASNATMKAFMNSADEKISAKHVRYPALIRLGEAGKARLAEVLLEHADAIWAEQIDPRGAGRIEHDTYLKLYQLSEPTLEQDVIFLDEAQDSNPVVLDIVQRQDHAQKVLVGDRAQNIYSFRGTENAMEALPEANRAVLSKSFRFGSAIADEANAWLELLGYDLRLTGFEQIDSKVMRVSTPDAVLVRTNGGAIAELMGAQDRGQRVYMAGQNRARELRNLAQAADDLIHRGFTPHPELSLMKSWMEVEEHADTDEGKSLAPLVKVVNKYGAPSIIQAIDSCAKSAKQADVSIATSHMAKGLEWDRVRIGGDYPQPEQDEDGKLVMPEAEELRLAYVAITRAQYELDPGSLGWIHHTSVKMRAAQR